MFDIRLKDWLELYSIVLFSFHRFCEAVRYCLIASSFQLDMLHIIGAQNGNAHHRWNWIRTVYLWDIFLVHVFTFLETETWHMVHSVWWFSLLLHLFSAVFNQVCHIWNVLTVFNDVCFCMCWYVLSMLSTANITH